ncbi:hypothetical protein [Allosphingosinicella humi]
MSDAGKGETQDHISQRFGFNLDLKSEVLIKNLSAKVAYQAANVFAGYRLQNTADLGNARVNQYGRPGHERVCRALDCVDGMDAGRKLDHSAISGCCHFTHSVSGPKAGKPHIELE